MSRAIDRLTEQVEQLSARVAELEHPPQQTDAPVDDRRAAAS
jgi:outer membrane murein-binding lipoprotein Lpp